MVMRTRYKEMIHSFTTHFVNQQTCMEGLLCASVGNGQKNKTLVFREVNAALEAHFKHLITVEIFLPIIKSILGWVLKSHLKQGIIF